MENYVTIKEVSAFLAVSISTIYHWVSQDYIPHYNLPNGLRFKLSEIEAWMKRKKRNGHVQLNPENLLQPERSIE